MDEKQFSEGSLLVILLSWTLPRFMKPSVWSRLAIGIHAAGNIICFLQSIWFSPFQFMKQRVVVYITGTQWLVFACQLLTWWLCRRDTKTVVHSSYKEKVNTRVRCCRQNICACWIFRPSMGWSDTVQTHPVLGIEALLFPRCLLGGLLSLCVDSSIHWTGLLTPGSFVSFS